MINNKLVMVLAASGLLCGCERKIEHHGSPKTHEIKKDSVMKKNTLYVEGTNTTAFGKPPLHRIIEANGNIAIGETAPWPSLSNSILIGQYAQYYSTQELHHIIVIGDDATASNNHELVIRFEDGTELRQALPKKNFNLKR